MNIEIANRLVNLRKSNNYSQEALAEKLGISRQAVSKWERAEASPDTDNLILLARLYGVSLDELLSTEDEIPRPERREEAGGYGETGSGIGSGIGGVGGSGKDGNGGSGGGDGETDNGGDSWPGKNEYVDISLARGIHVRDNDGSEVHVGWNGIHVDDRKKGDNVHVGKKGVYVNGEKYDGNYFREHYRHKFPMMLVITIAFLLLGVFYDLWHPGWMLFLLIPVWGTFVDAVYHKNAHEFAYPVVAVIIFLMLGFFRGAWHPGWVVFLTIPLYYSLVGYLQWRAEDRKREREEKGKTDGNE